jgi:hypothetical protein
MSQALLCFTLIVKLIVWTGYYWECHSADEETEG